MDRHNLFRFATKELSHSAFWAWVFQATDAKDEALEGPRAVGRRALRTLYAHPTNTNVSVKTEVPFPSGDRPDLKIELAEGNALFVELKRSASFSEQQIERYREAIGEGGAIALISTRYDAGKAEGICPYLGLKDIREILAPHRGSHPLLSDYAEWIDERFERRATIDENASASDSEKVENALATLYGQKLVMEEITANMNGRWKQSNASYGGEPYTEFWIAEADESQDTLFYRIDQYSPGYYFSLKQYMGDKKSNAWGGKEERLEQLRQWWIEAKKEANHNLIFRGPHNRGSKTCEVGCLLFKHNPPTVVAKDFPKVHRAFTDRLKANGWDLNVDD